MTDFSQLSIPADIAAPLTEDRKKPKIPKYYEALLTIAATDEAKQLIADIAKSKDGANAAHEKLQEQGVKLGLTAQQAYALSFEILYPKTVSENNRTVDTTIPLTYLKKSQYQKFDALYDAYVKLDADRSKQPLGDYQEFVGGIVRNVAYNRATENDFKELRERIKTDDYVSITSESRELALKDADRFEALVKDVQSAIETPQKTQGKGKDCRCP